MYQNEILNTIKNNFPVEISTQCYFDNNCLIVPTSLGAEKVYFVLENTKKFHSYPTILEV